MSFVPGTLVVLVASRKLYWMHLLKPWVKQMMKCCAPIRRGVVPQYYCELDTFYIYLLLNIIVLRHYKQKRTIFGKI